MTEFDTPKFPFSTPEDIRQASEKVMNFWVGALSPMWVPFWAASSFGVSAWALTQSLTKAEGVASEMPTTLSSWPTMGSLWGKIAESSEAFKETVQEVVAAPSKVVLEVEEAAVETVFANVSPPKTVVKAAAAEKVAPMVTPDVAPVITTEGTPVPDVAPVKAAAKTVEKATDAAVDETATVVEAAAKTATKPALKTAAKITPKPIALSATKKPRQP